MMAGRLPRSRSPRVGWMWMRLALRSRGLRAWPTASSRRPAAGSGSAAGPRTARRGGPAGEGRVAVAVVLKATNHLKDSVARRVFFRTAVLTVLPGTSGFRIIGGSGNPKVSVAQRAATFTNLRIDLGANLAAGKSTTLTLTF